MRKSKRSLSVFFKRGFTLLETLVTIGIVIMVIALALASLVGSVNGTKTASKMTSYDFEIMRVYGQMRRQLLSLYKNPNTKWKCFVGKKENQPRFDSMRFFTTASAQGSGTVEVFYSIQKDEDGNTYLAYRESPFTRDMEKAEKDGEFDAEYSLVLSSKVKGMSIICEENGKEVEVWDKEGMPDRIKVKIYYELNKKENCFEFSAVPAVKMF